MLSGFSPRPLKKLFTANQCWTSFLDAGGMRDIEVEAVTKMLASGKKATDLWIAAQLNRLPDCDWQHLVFTLPDTLWPLFEVNRWLLNDLCRLAVDNLLYAAGMRGLDIGIFCAIHTYGRRLNWHPHIHVSVTCGGIDTHGKWKKISFRKDAMRARWMWNIHQMLLSA